MRICIVGASGKLGRYMVQHALDQGYEVVAVCREQSVGKLAEFEDRINIVPGATDDREVIKRAVAGCDGVLVVLVPRGVHGYSSGTAQAVLDHAEPGARLVFSCGWHITRDGQDVYSWRLKALVNVAGRLGRLARGRRPRDPGSSPGTTGWGGPGASSPATPAGPSCVAATSRRATARACRCGAATWATPSSSATSRAAWTSPYSWWRPSRTTILFTRPRRSSAARVLRRSRTQLPEPPSASHPRLPPSCEQHEWLARVTVAPAWQRNSCRRPPALLSCM